LCISILHLCWLGCQWHRPTAYVAATCCLAHTNCWLRHCLLDRLYGSEHRAQSQMVAHHHPAACHNPQYLGMEERLTATTKNLATRMGLICPAARHTRGWCSATAAIWLHYRDRPRLGYRKLSAHGPAHDRLPTFTVS